MIADPEILLTLAARAEAGGDVTLSDDCWRAMGYMRFGVQWTAPDGITSFRPRPDLCTSIDAQAALPGRVVECRQMRDGSWRAWPEGHETLDVGVGGHAPTEPLARLAALLRAMAAKDNEHGQ